VIEPAYPVVAFRYGVERISLADQPGKWRSPSQKMTAAISILFTKYDVRFSHLGLRLDANTTTNSIDG